jgi:hypothetical protein
MRESVVSVLLVIAMVGAVVGVRAHGGDGMCPMDHMPNCCKKAQSQKNTPEVAMARVCCNLNCSEPVLADRPRRVFQRSKVHYRALRQLFSPHLSVVINLQRAIDTNWL